MKNERYKPGLNVTMVYVFKLCNSMKSLFVKLRSVITDHYNKCNNNEKLGTL